MAQETPILNVGPTPLRPPIATFDDDGRDCRLEGTGLVLLVNIMRIGQHWGRPAFYEDLDERMQAEVRLWARSRPTEEDDPVAHQVRAHCKKLLEFEDERGR